MRKILYVTRPISMRLDEASKNIAFYLSKNITKFEIHLMTIKGFQMNAGNVVCEPIYSNDNLIMGLNQRIRLILRLIIKNPRVDAYHFFFTPTLITSKIITKIIGNSTKTIQSVPCLPKDFTRENAKKLFFSDAVIVNSKHTEKILKDSGISNVHRINPFVEVEKFDTKLKINGIKKDLGLKNEFVVFYPGEYKRLDAIDTVLKVIKNYKKEKNIKFILACRIKNKEEQKLESKIKDQIGKEGLNHLVIFLNTIDKIPEFISLSNVLLFPAKNLEGKFDFPLVILEGLAGGLPVIITDISPLNEIANMEGVLRVKPGDVNSVITIIERLRNNPKEASLIGQKGKESAKKEFNAKLIAKEYQNIYTELFE